jgi:hypothetical protein
MKEIKIKKINNHFGNPPLSTKHLIYNSWLGIAKFVD